MQMLEEVSIGKYILNQASKSTYYIPNYHCNAQRGATNIALVDTWREEEKQNKSHIASKVHLS